PFRIPTAVPASCWGVPSTSRRRRRRSGTSAAGWAETSARPICRRSCEPCLMGFDDQDRYGGPVCSPAFRRWGGSKPPEGGTTNKEPYRFWLSKPIRWTVAVGQPVGQQLVQQFGQGLRLQLLHDPGAARFHGLVADVQLPGDEFVG